MITAEEVRLVFDYNPDTGTLTRKLGGHGVKAKYIGVPLGHPHPTKGHLVVGYKRRYYKVHRLAWLYMTGGWPVEQIDHINRNPSDNRWLNLRAATHSQNIWNQKSKLGRMRGAYKCNTTGRWTSSITHENKAIWLGRFDTAEQAATAYDEAARRLRGEFHISSRGT